MGTDLPSSASDLECGGPTLSLLPIVAISSYVPLAMGNAITNCCTFLTLG
jgi:hypothetical protein